jgi:hypothetical protein
MKQLDERKPEAGGAAGDRYAHSGKRCGLHGFLKNLLY